VYSYDDGPPLITIPQKDFLKTLCWQKHITTAEICKVAGVRFLTRMPRSQASELIDLLKNNDGDLKRKIAEIRGQLSLM
jgi:hypothetical protein